jgi:protein arginine N-methyltransferase 2
MGLFAENVAKSFGNGASWKVLREWAVQRGDENSYQYSSAAHALTSEQNMNSDDIKPMNMARLDAIHKNKLFCNSSVLFTNPVGAPEDEVAMVTAPDGTGVMMEWERPISKSFPLRLQSFKYLDL